MKAELQELKAQVESKTKQLHYASKTVVKIEAEKEQAQSDFFFFFFFFFSNVLLSQTLSRFQVMLNLFAPNWNKSKPNSPTPLAS
jgi:hypothetical protein